MIWTDGHLDLAYVALEPPGRDLRVPCAADVDGCISLPALRAACVDTVFATIFTAPNEAGPSGYASVDDADGAEAAGRRQLAVYESLEAGNEVTIVRSARDLDADTAAPRLVVLMEGADPIRDAGHVTWWVERGLRLVGLTWASGTRYAGGNGGGGPLTPRGRDLVTALDAHGVVHDASHLSDEAFDGVIAHARGPVVATHSNCRALLSDDQRHLRDDQIRAIDERGGIVGLNLFTRFLAAGRRATVDDALSHVEHVTDVMGHRRGVGLGSDMDGGFGASALPEGVDHPERLGALADGLRARGWNDAEVAGFAGGNWRRFLVETCGALRPTALAD
jgi:membrane dipeptidase